MPRTQEERKADTRGRLVAAASDLFAQRGYHAVSTEAVASAADRTTGALYAHFGGKEGLLLAVLEEWVERTSADLAASIEGEDDLDGRLGALWGGIVRADSASGDAWLLLEFELWLHAARHPALGDAGAQRFRLMRDGLAGALVQWSADFGFALPGPADDVAAQVIALLLGAAFQYRLDPTVIPRALVVDGLRRLLDLPVEPSLAAAAAPSLRAAAPARTPRKLASP